MASLCHPWFTTTNLSYRPIGFLFFSAGAKGAEAWVSDVALWRSRGRVALRRCDAWASDAATLLALRRCDAGVTLRRCWRCDSATLRRGSDAATLLALRRCDAVSREGRCDAVGAATLRRGSDAATRERRCDAVGAATLPSARVHTALRRGATRKPPLKIVNECRSLYITGLKELNPYWRSSMNVEV